MPTKDPQRVHLCRNFVHYLLAKLCEWKPTLRTGVRATNAPEYYKKYEFQEFDIWFSSQAFWIWYLRQLKPKSQEEIYYRASSEMQMLRTRHKIMPACSAAKATEVVELTGRLVTHTLMRSNSHLKFLFLVIYLKDRSVDQIILLWFDHSKFLLKRIISVY